MFFVGFLSHVLVGGFSDLCGVLSVCPAALQVCL